jgi:hypothetical protein
MTTETGPPQKETEGEGDVYLYKAAGLREHHGRIPLWLILVAIGLLVWGVYYMIRYW